MEIAPEFRQFLRNYQFRLFNSVSNPELMEEFSVGLGAETIQADDKDDAHDNIDYLVSKAREQTHNLSHLQIDPKIIQNRSRFSTAKKYPSRPSWDRLGAVLGRSWAILTGLGAMLGRFWAGWGTKNVDFPGVFFL